MGVDKKFNITYTETVTYEEIVLAENKNEAKRLFEEMIQNDEIEPTMLEIVQYDVEQDVEIETP